MLPNAQDFQDELNNIFLSAQQQGRTYVNVKSGDLHRKLGGYPSQNHRMPVCCDVMKRNMNQEDTILQQPPSEKGATSLIRFKIPR